MVLVYQISLLKKKRYRQQIQQSLFMTSFHKCSKFKTNMATGRQPPSVTSVPFVVLHHIAKYVQLPITNYNHRREDQEQFS